MEKIKTIGIRKLRPNMILAEDAVNKQGVVIMAKNTMINDTNYTTLKSHNILNVKVWEQSIDKTRDILTKEVNVLEEQMREVTAREDFKAFEDEYQNEVSKTKENLLAIGDGIGGDVEGLYTGAKAVIDKINCKSDLLKYISYLKVSDEHTYQHSLNVALLCNLFAAWANFSETDTKLLTISGMLHDIGKLKVDSNILNKKGKLTHDEFEKIKEHTTLGYEIVQDLDIPEEVKEAVLMHHEKSDGSGYPFGLKSNKIGRFAKAVEICDIYDAMTSKRCYRDKICPFDVIESFEYSNFGVLDTECLLIFLQNISYSYMGSWVQVSGGKVGEIVFINRQYLSKPIIKMRDTGEFINLLDCNVKIENVL